MDKITLGFFAGFVISTIIDFFIIRNLLKERPSNVTDPAIKKLHSVTTIKQFRYLLYEMFDDPEWVESFNLGKKIWDEKKIARKALGKISDQGEAD